MNGRIVSEAVARPVGLVTVMLMWITTVPLAIWAGLYVDNKAAEPMDNPPQFVVFLPASLAFLSIWPVALDPSVATFLAP